jgi:hypothetical protein
MKIKNVMIACIVICGLTCSSFKNTKMKNSSEYKVVHLTKPLSIDGNWDKPEWKKIEAIDLRYFMGDIPKFRPTVKAKLMYNDDNLFVIFQVKDQYVRCVASKINGPVWEDSCVEFFFSPDSDSPLKYFNLETNCGGTALMFYNLEPRKDFVILNPEDISQIEIAHSLPKFIDPEIPESLTWTLEYRLPLQLLKKYGKVSQPSAGVIWKANFYKIADKTSNPHYLTWSHIEQAEPDFHKPAFFGKLIFQ